MDTTLEQNQAALTELAETLEWAMGEFHLLLARCNYAQLRSHLLTQLQAQCSIPLLIVEIEPGNPNLLSQIRDQMRWAIPEKAIEAIVVTGFEQVEDPTQLFATADQAREEFRKTLPHPILFWFDDQSFQAFTKHSPNLVTWTPVDSPIFALSEAVLLDSLRQGIASIYQMALDPQCLKLPTSLKAIDPLGTIYRRELPYALDALNQSNFDPDFAADIHFLQGLNRTLDEKTQPDPEERASHHFHQSIAYWRSRLDKTGDRGGWVNGRNPNRQTAEPTPNPSQEGDRPVQNPDFDKLSHQSKTCAEPVESIQNSLRLAIILFFLGRHYFWRVNKRRRYDTANYCLDDWHQVCQPLEESICLFEQVNRPDMVVKVIRRFQGALRQSENWQALAHWSERAVALHQTYGPPDRLAMAYAFQSEASLNQGEYAKACELAHQALHTLAQLATPKPWAEGLYLSLLGQAKRQLGQVDEAIAHLERAQDLSSGNTPTIYRTILEELRQLYRIKKRYLEAFKLKQRRLEVEKIEGLRAFVGAGRLGAVSAQLEDGQLAPEILASGRQQDLDRLLERIGRTDYRLTIIYGDSGVGKSSLMNAGLIPSLQRKAIGTRPNAVVLMRKYGTWIETLNEHVTKVWTDLRSPGAETDGSIDSPGLAQAPDEALSGVSQVLQALSSDYHHFRPVLIFDQFEEFFFANPLASDRRRFFEFLGEALAIPFVNVVISLRQDYIHFLLGANQLECMAIINHDILSKQVLYPLGNFSPQEATAIIQDLTQRSRTYFEPDLVTALVQDLAGASQNVRPIELQIIGTQLETEGIRTLNEYIALGNEPKEELVSRYLDDVVDDCGPEYRQLAKLVLYLLTDERGLRPAKTQAELLRELTTLPLLGQKGDPLDRQAPLDYVMRIMGASGMVMYLPETPDDRYQLVHDYIAEIIRVRQEPQVEQLRAELAAERDRRRQAEDRKKELAQNLEVMVQDLNQTKTNLAQVETNVSLAQAKLQDAETAREWAIKATEIEVAGLGALRQAEFAQLDALINVMHAAHRLKQLSQADTRAVYPSFSPVFALQQILDTIREKNRMSGFQEWVGGIDFHPYESVLISGNAGGLVVFWDYQGHKLYSFKAVDGCIRDLKISANGAYIAVAGDRTIKVFTLQGQEISTCVGHESSITSIDFHPNSDCIGSASKDGTAILWNLDGHRRHILKGHKHTVNAIRFNSTGRVIATASGDRTVRKWNMKGEHKLTIEGFNGWVSSLSFHPNTKTLATASSDGMVKFWQGSRLMREFQTNQGEVRDILFAPDGKTIATAGDNSTICIWALGKHQTHSAPDVLRGHLSQVRKLAFRPDGQILATAGLDRTIRFWHMQPKRPVVCTGHHRQANSVQFSPDGKLLLTASADRTARLWDRQGNELTVFRGHQKRVWSACFSPDGQWIATSSTDGTASLWRIGDQGKIALRHHTNWVKRICFSPDGQYVATASADGTSCIWDRQGQPLQVLDDGQELWDVSFSPDGQYLATAGASGMVSLWTLSGQRSHQFKAHDFRVSRVCFSPNGQRLATASADYQAKVWSFDEKHLQSIAPQAELRGHQGEVWDIAFSPDGQTLATASLDRTLRLWRQNGHPITEFRGHRDGVYSVTFSPDGRTLASASSDRTARLWTIETLDQLLERGCDWVRDYVTTNSLVNERDVFGQIC